MKRIKVTVSLPDETVKQLQAMAATAGCSVTEMIRRSISAQAFLSAEILNGNRILLDRDGSIREVVFR